MTSSVITSIITKPVITKIDDDNRLMYLKLNKYLSNKEVNELIRLFDVNNVDFTPSKVFNSETKENIVDEGFRKSQKKSYNDSKLFDVADSWVDYINECLESHFVTLLTDEIEVVKYNPGNYFRRHKDFIKYKSNYVDCMSLLVCLVGSVGGATILHFNKKIMCQQTITPGSILLFRNDIEHECDTIKEGVKIILKFNVLCYPNKSGLTYEISFHTSDKKCYLPMEMINKFPNSYFAANNHFNSLCTLDITYEKFSEYLKYILVNNGNISLKNTDEIGKLCDYYGIKNEFCNNLYSVIHTIYDNLLLNVQLLSESPSGTIMLASSIKSYENYKFLYQSIDNIIPVQIIGHGNFIRIFVYDCIPLLMLKDIPETHKEWNKLWCDSTYKFISGIVNFEKCLFSAEKNEDIEQYEYITEEISEKLYIIFSNIFNKYVFGTNEIYGMLRLISLIINSAKLYCENIIVYQDLITTLSNYKDKKLEKTLKVHKIDKQNNDTTRHIKSMVNIIKTLSTINNADIYNEVNHVPEKVGKLRVDNEINVLKFKLNTYFNKHGIFYDNHTHSYMCNETIYSRIECDVFHGFIKI